MPKHSEAKTVLIKKWCQNTADFKIIDSSNIYCTVCDKRITCDRKFQVEQHLRTALHKQKKANRTGGGTLQQLLRSNTNNSVQEKQAKFSKELCRLFVGCDIPLYKLDHPLFQTFLKTHCTSEHIVNVPSSSILRKKYVDINYQDTMAEIKEKIGKEFVWFSVDETTDITGRYIANLVLGTLKENEPGRSYLVSVKALEKTNHVTIARFVNESLSNFYLPNPIPVNKILLMVTGAAPYVIKSSNNLKVFYPNLIHCTCLAHGLNRVAETVRSEYNLVNGLVSNIKKVFVKAPLRVQMYKESNPELPLPPEPVLTRWGTWLKCVDFLATNYIQIKKVV